MSFCRLFIERPVATTLIALAIFLTGAISLPTLPIASMPDLTATAIMVIAQQPGADPNQMATSVTTPLERRLAAISDVVSLESSSENGQATILLEFSPSRNINGALRDVQAALRAARSDLPLGTLDSDPFAFKLDGGGSPVYLLSMTSKQLSTAQLYDLATISIQPILSQVHDVGRVEIVGASTPSIRVELNPYPLYKWGIGLEDIRAALASANAYTPKGFITLGEQQISLATNDQVLKAKDYRDLIIAYRNNHNPIALRDVAQISDNMQDIYQFSSFNGENAVTILVMPQPHANALKIVDNINLRLAHLHDILPENVSLHSGIDLSSTIRASVADAKSTLIISVILVIVVITIFFHHFISTLIPAITVPIVLSGTISVMAACHFTLDILSLMALTIAVGFVVDDAIVVLENIARYMELGLSKKEASIKGASEITFTILSISLSLVAVFIPLLFIPGTLGSIFYEFSITIIATILISMFLSLTLTPMMCAQFLDIDNLTQNNDKQDKKHTLTTAFLNQIFTKINAFYKHSLEWSLSHPILIFMTLPGSFILMISMIIIMPKEPIPSPDMSLIQGRVNGEPSLSFHALSARLAHIEKEILQNKHVTSVTTLSQTSQNGEFFIQLRDKYSRPSIETIANELNHSISKRPGAEAMFWPLSSNRKGGAGDHDTGNYRYVLHSDNASELYEIMPKLIARLRENPSFFNLSSDTEQQALALQIGLNRSLEARYNITPQLIQNALFDSYGQTIVSTIHIPLTTHRVVMVLAEKWRENPTYLHHLWVSTSAGTAAGGVASNLIRVRERDENNHQVALATSSINNELANHISGSNSSGAPVSSSMETMIPLDNLAKVTQTPQPLTITHRDGYYACALSFDLAKNIDYNDALKIIDENLSLLHAKNIRGAFTGTTGETETLMKNFLLAFLVAVAVMYITLGTLYENFFHPITILSTLPSAGIGGILALWLSGESFSLIAFIAIILLTGLVKKNAILVIDFALHAERNLHLSPKEAILQASLTRFRPILMTSMAAALGAIPLIFNNGYGSELRQPLGIAILGGMVVSQLLTLYTTPVIYLWMDAASRLSKKLIKNIFFSKRKKPSL